LLEAGGHGRAPNLSHAFEWFKISAERGNSTAKLSLGMLYLRGDGVEKDEARAIALFEDAAANGQLEAMYLLGQMHRFGLGTAINSGEAESWLRRAAVRGHLKAMTNLGSLLLEGPVPDPAGAAMYLRQAAEGGDPDAQVLLGQMYCDGKGVPVDPKLALRWFKAAAEQASSVALERIGALYAEGAGVDQDEAEAANWFRRAAESGNPVALFNLGVLEESKTPAERDLRLARHWYEQAAGLESGQACLRLGILSLSDGEEGLSDGVRWFARGAELGDLDSMCNLGLLSVRGEAAPLDCTNGIELLERAAGLGSTAAAWALHNIYREGRFLVGDQLKASQWLNVAAGNGCPIAGARIASEREAEHLEARPSTAGKS
jgi:TPR repeat protein